jgi:tetratricopeptide (TPR) repeat protein
LAWRFLYIPLAAAIPLFATFLSRILRPMFFCLLVAALVLFYAAELLPHVRHYGLNDREFWLNLHHVERESRIFRLNHATVLLPVNEQKAVFLLESLIKDKSSYQADFFRRRALEIVAIYCTSVNHLEKARSYFSTLFSEYKEQPLNVYFQYANFLAKSGNPEKGQEIVSYYLQVFPENHEVLLHGADFFLLTKNYPRALQLLQKDFQLFPTNAVLERIRKLRLNQQQD